MKTSHEPAFADIHCHLLPGIDDGPRDWAGCLALARLLVADGVETAIATPHQLGRYEANTADRILDLAVEAQQRLNEACIPLTVLPGADVRIREDLVDLVRRGDVLTLGDRQAHLLLELPHEQALPLGKLLFDLQGVGVSCILSHPERNAALARDPDLLRPWVQQGCLIQITAGSIVGRFGRDAQKVSQWLLREGLAHIVASDAHDTERRPPLLREAFATVARWADEEVAHQLFIANPQAVVQGEAVDIPLPASTPRPRGLSSWWSSALAALGG